MKQLSLLLLAITTGCFAAELAPCWNVIYILTAHPEIEELHLIDGFADCSRRYEQIKRLEKDADLRPSYKEALAKVSSFIAFVERKDTLEAAIARDEAEQARLQAIIIDPSFLDESREIFEKKTRELKERA